MGKFKGRVGNLNEKPKRLAYTDKLIAIGDLHGNALKLIYTLIEEGIINDLSISNYHKLRDIYNKNVSQLRSYDLYLFSAIVNSFKIDNTRHLVLIGDDLADRGQNDYFTLLVLQKLHNENLKVNIILSNHTVEFLRDYERDKFTGKCTMSGSFVTSLKNMVYLIQKGLVKEKYVRDIVKACYIPKLKVLSYSSVSVNSVTIYTHAPVGFETIKFLNVCAQRLRRSTMEYNDSSPLRLANIINDINAAFIGMIGQGEGLVSKIDEQENTEIDCQQTPIPYFIMPLQRILWNRVLGGEFRAIPYSPAPYNVQFVHGHVGEQTFCIGDKVCKEVSQKLANIDNLLGKSLDHTRAVHSTWQASDTLEWVHAQKGDVPVIKIPVRASEYPQVTCSLRI